VRTYLAFDEVLPKRVVAVLVRPNVVLAEEDLEVLGSLPSVVCERGERDAEAKEIRRCSSLLDGRVDGGLAREDSDSQ
jgi:hypothetical protein